MASGEVKGYFLFGQNPAGAGPNARLHRAGLAQLDWLVTLDWIAYKEGSFSNTQRLLQWHDKALDREEDCRNEGIVRQASDFLDIRDCPNDTAKRTLNGILSPHVRFDPARLTRHVFASSSCGL